MISQSTCTTESFAVRPRVPKDVAPYAERKKGSSGKITSRCNYAKSSLFHGGTCGLKQPPFLVAALDSYEIIPLNAYWLSGCLKIRPRHVTLFEIFPLKL